MDSLYRAAGRCGLGAVMGSKNLKAIVCRGELDIEVEKPDEFISVIDELLEKMKRETITGETLPMRGTDALTNTINEEGIYPVRNFMQGCSPEADKLSGETLRGTILVKNRACRFCWIRCARYSVVKSGPYAGVTGEGPEYETVWAFGGQCGIFRLDAIHAANTLCNKYGIDTISTGNIIGWAMELYERGIINKEETDGLDLKFGNHEAMVELTKRIALREGKFADTLAEGWLKAAEKIGKRSDRFIMGVKGLGLPAYEPRGVWGHGLSYATSIRGGCHLRAYMIVAEILAPTLSIPEKMDPLTTKGKAEMCKFLQEYYAIIDSAIVCKFVTFALTAGDLAKALTPATGFEYTTEEVLRIGERIYNLERMIQCREGIRRKDDTLPQRLLKEPAPVGPAAGKTVPLDVMLNEYYKLRGWDAKTGIPTVKKLRELGLKKEAEEAKRLLEG
jgi:aldehyde:ferredoxin oxidoreductase